MVSPKFRVKSIYDVPIIKLILDNLDYELVQPNSEQSKLFNVKDKMFSYDIEIIDILEGYGVSIEGEEEYVSSITSLLLEKVPNSIRLQHPVQLHAVYNGKVVHVNYEKNLSVIDIGENINTIMFGSDFHRGQKIVVQIKQLNIFEDQLPVCSTIIHFPGQTVILERDANFVRVSRKLPKTDRDKLFELGKKLRPIDHGLIMRTSASASSSEAIQADIDHLVQGAEELDLLISGSSYGPGILQPGQTVAHTLFPKDAKDTLTSIRNEIIPTIPLYHWFMSYSPELKITAMFAEKVSSEIDGEKLSQILKQIILDEDFSDNTLIRLQEYRLTSPPQERVLGQLNIKDDILTMKRSFRSSRGVHYGLSSDIQQGDTSIVITKEGSWTIHSKISRDEKIIGELVKVVTPIELFEGSRIRFIDLGLTIIKQNDDIEIKDEGLVRNLSEQGIISSTFKDKVYTLFEECQKQIEDGNEQILILSE
ncbi:MAG: ribonuclease E/G [Candidatus Heimdallarchaeota archaeon]|nr:ribonuclease E/G [Candidatus Heimdallarchaeota archaeon]MCK4971825.1 ribonuclease E/G [Candidatus Heimdallarchaeota archaeon]